MLTRCSEGGRSLAIVRLVFALLLSLPLFAGASSLILTTSFLVEFLGQGRWRPLSALSHEPAVRPLPTPPGPRPVAVDLHVRAGVFRPPALVLVHGLSPEGKNDPRLREAAGLLARSGWAVAVPTLDGLTVLRLRPEDASAVSATVKALRDAGYHRVAVLGISLGAGPALLAAADPDIAPGVSATLALGGYASAVELLRYTLTGAYAYGGVSGRHPVQEAAIAEFARANTELVDEAGRRLVENRDPANLDALVRALPQSTRDLLDALSPGRTLEGLRAPLFLIHGRQDPAVPFTESLRLEAAARAAGRPVRAAIVGAVGHVEANRRAGLADLLRLWATFYAFRLTAQR
ncbi:MAG TPA: prolyl oligopeptidase family serine peptidase [Methylomirabilota bacterium]|nr:prolyl oligopeptidase family serine peptidase [Methylomirabilota bacterium]